jgi:hypothetical protein
MVGCHDTGRILFYWHRNCGSKLLSFTFVQLTPTWISRLPQERLRIRDATYRKPSKECISVSYLQSYFMWFSLEVLPIGILLFYIGGVTVIGLLVPSNSRGLGTSSQTAAASPFVIAIQNAGIKSLPSVCNLPSPLPAISPRCVADML